MTTEDTDPGITPPLKIVGSMKVVRNVVRNMDGAAQGEWHYKIGETGHKDGQMAQAADVLAQALEEARQHYADDIDWLMEVIRRLEGLTSTHVETDVDDVLHGVEIRARSREMRAALAQFNAATEEATP